MFDLQFYDRVIKQKTELYRYILLFLPDFILDPNFTITSFIV